MRNSKKTYAVIAVISIIMAIIAEIFLFMMGVQIEYQGTPISILNSQYPIQCVGYSVNGKEYTPNTDDPQIIISNVNQVVEYVVVDFASDIPRGTRVELFYAKSGEVFTQENSTQTITNGLNQVILRIPYDTYESLRVDINTNFSLEQIYVSSEPVTMHRQIVESFNMERFVVMVICAFIVMAALFYWWSSPKTAISLNKIELIFCIGVFLYYFAWVITQPYNYAPDEAMRYDVTEFLYNNNRLPQNDELLSVWGFSYAHMPTVLCNQLGYVFMKIASVFKQSDFFLLVAARMVSVCCATIGVYFVIKIAKQLFSSPARWIAIIVFAFMPQYSFLASYVNNDIIAVCGSCIIVYSWILAIKHDWNIKNGVMLSLGISICALSYYNSYIWILLSMFVVTFTYFHKHKGDYKGFVRTASWMCAIVLVLISYNFIRHIILYGDVLGLETTKAYGEMYAVDYLKPSARISLQNQGISLYTMLFDNSCNWVHKTYVSFIATFGYMEYETPYFIYQAVKLFIVIGGVGILVNIINRFRNKIKQALEMKIFYSSMVVCSIFSVSLSIYNSYTYDFQPQGRYCYSMFIALIILVTKGYEALVLKIKRKEQQYAVVAAICAAGITGAFFIYQMIYLPSLHL